MKVPCPEHGAHFRHEFEATMKSDCPLWEIWGLQKMPVREKLVLWQWLFKAPFDEIFGRSAWAVGILIGGRRQRAKHFWQKHIKGYLRMNEKQRQAAQKKYILSSK